MLPMLRRRLLHRHGTWEHQSSMASSDFKPSQWWQTGVVYQVYPRSFQDTNGDGVGDLRGIIARLDYFRSLGVDTLWISPFYPSPMADFGYDVADYTDVDPLFGSLADFDELLAEAHKRGLRVVLDFVPNHTSDLHAWFLESRSSRESPKRDWYIWHDAPPAGDDFKPARERLPNNWTSQFGGSAWEWDERTEQFYLHSFLKQQPDLNWRNPQVRAAMYEAMQFWLDRGVDGFRMDVLWLLIKDQYFRNNPPNPEFHGDMHDHAATLPVFTANQAETLMIVAEMRTLLDTYGDTLTPEKKNLEGESNRVLIGEIYLPLAELIEYYGTEKKGALSEPGVPQLNGANLPFNFHLIQTRWEAAAVAQIITDYERLLPDGAWPNYVLGNHDQSRLATRIGKQQTRAAAMLLLTLRGTPTMYYGDELGMEDVPITPNQVQDPAEKNEPGKGRGRDPERSPMLWIPAENAGFTFPDVKPWLPIEREFETKNAAVQSKDLKSIFTLYRTLLHYRRTFDTLHAGGITDVHAEGSVLRFKRTTPENGDAADFQVLLNLGSEIATVHCAKGKVLVTTLLDGTGADVDGEVTLEAGEGLLIALEE
ncbi:MAG: alpha-amylase family glycosyl hydrolase [Acidobacteriaceae bacterium]|nr:alpha-amylase family glycosyl hydrolase [Acidobacteriaceae bacterium]